MSKRANGEGTIYKRQTDGLWCASIYIESNGKYKRKYIYAKTQKQVKEKLNNLKNISSKGIDVERGDISLDKWVLEWLQSYKIHTLKITTYENYFLNYQVHIRNSEIGNIPIKKLTTRQLQIYYNHLLRNKKKNLSIRTVRYIASIINGALEQAVKSNILIKNVNKGCVLPKKEKIEIQPLTVNEIEKLLETAKGNSLYPIILLEIFTGMRKGEILGLQWKDVNFIDKELYVRNNLARINDEGKYDDEKNHTKLALLNPKTAASKRTIPLNDKVIDELKKHKNRQNRLKMKNRLVWEEQDMVFCKSNGLFYDPRKLLEEYHQLLKKAGIRKSRFHDLRHTFASILLNQGESIKTIQSLLGHADITTSMAIYAHLSEDKKRETIVDMLDVINVK